jgi:hypothetical protein
MICSGGVVRLYSPRTYHPAGCVVVAKLDADPAIEAGRSSLSFPCPLIFNNFDSELYVLFSRDLGYPEQIFQKRFSFALVRQVS